jgi:hypothetical protein
MAHGSIPRVANGSSVEDLVVSRSLLGIVSELLFVLLPLLVLLLVYIHQGRGGLAIARAPDWSFATVVLIGQTVTKLVSGVAGSGRKRPWQAITLVATSLIVLGLVPALMVLGFMLAHDTPSTLLVAGQFLLFVLSVAGFLTLGSAGHVMLAEAGVGEENS